MDTLKKMRVISILWGMILITLFLLVTIFGIFYKNKTKLYIKEEEKLVDACRSYVDANKLYSDKKLNISFNELKEAGFINELSVESDDCDGYVIVKNKESMEYKSYIKCGKYATGGYSKNK